MPRNGFFADDGRVSEAFDQIHTVNNAARIDAEKFRTADATDKAVLDAAFAASQNGSTVLLGNGRTYTLTAALAPVLDDNVSLDGNGATLDVSAVPTGFGVDIRGQFLPATAMIVSTAVLTNVIKVATTVGMVPGMLVWIQSQAEVENPDRLTVFKEEVARIKSAAGTTLTLDANLWNTYDVTGGVIVTPIIPVKNLHITNLHVKGVADKSVIQIKGVDGLRAELISIDAPGATDGFIVNVGMDIVVSNSRAENVNRVGYGYGFHFTVVNDVRAVDLYGHNNRHTIDADRARNVQYRGITAVADSSSGISTHGSTDAVTIRDCAAIRCGGGIITRGKNTTIAGCTVKGTKGTPESADSYIHGIRIGDEGGTYGMGNGGIGLRIYDNTVDISDFVGEELAECFHSTAQSAGIKMRGNRFIGANGHVVSFVGDKHSGIRIEDNYIDASRQVAASYMAGVIIAPVHQVSGNTIVGVDIENNTISATGGYGIAVKGAVDTVTLSDMLSIRRNRIGNCSSARINISQNWGSIVEVTENSLQGLAANGLGVFAPVNAYVRNNVADRPVRMLGAGQEMGARIRSGIYYSANVSSSAAATPAVNRMMATPIFIPRLVRVSKLAVNVTTAAAASSVRLALYADVEDGQGGYPGALVAGSEVVVSSTVIGFVEGSIDVYLNPGLYWLVAASQGGTPALTCVTGMGTNVVGYQAAGTSAGRIAWVVDGVAGVFPATFDANANGQGGAPMVQFKVV